MSSKTKASGSSFKKRPASSPSQGINKELKEMPGDMDTGSTGSTQPLKFAAATTAGLSLTTTTMATASGSTITTMTLINNRQYEEDKSVFKTTEPEGGFRDEIIVSIDTLNDEPYKGTITVREAVKEIFIGILEFEREALASVSRGAWKQKCHGSNT